MKKFCPKCWNEVNNENIKFCPKCWNEFNIKEEIINEELENNNDITNWKIEENHKFEKVNNRRNIVDKENWSWIELDLKFKHIVIILIVLFIWYGFYYYNNNKDYLNEKIGLLLSNDSETEIISDNKENEKSENEKDNITSSWWLKEDNKEGTSTWLQSENIDERAKEYLVNHYNDIASHNFKNAYWHFDRDNLVINWKKIIDNPTLANASLEWFSKLWKNVSKIEITNFIKLDSDLKYTYDVNMNFDDWTYKVYTTIMVLKLINDNEFMILEYSSKEKEKNTERPSVNFSESLEYDPY